MFRALSLMKDHFEDIYNLVSKKQYQAALNQLYSRKTNRIKPPYTIDHNHSWYLVGDIFFKLGKFDASLDAFKRSIRSRKDDWQALWAIADCYSEMGRPVFAERYFKRALQHSDVAHKRELQYNIGNALFDQGKFDASIKQYTTILKSGNDDLTKLAKINIEAAKKQIKAKQHNHHY